jgi:hypothetical protein
MTKFSFLLLLSCSLFLQSCKDERAIEAMIWKGGVHEITRDLENEKEEYLETDDPKFLQFRAMHKEDMKRVVKMARKYCEKSSNKLTVEETEEREVFFDSLNQASKFFE